MTLDLTKPTAQAASPDWYERRHDLKLGMVFIDYEGDAVLLDRHVPGDGTKLYVATWYGGSWAYYDSTIEPGDLRGEPIADNAGAIEAALAKALEMAA